MLIYVITAISLGFVIYGALIYKRLHTPYMAKATVEEEFIDPWCKTEGISKILLGIDCAFIALYLSEGILKYIGIAGFIALSIYITYIRYQNNAKYLK